MNTTPAGNRLHIGFFGKRNVGKSSLINALTGQEISIVSEVPGTTTDPVGKTMEIRGLGPVYLYDTAGMDDEGDLGGRRVARTRQILGRIDVAVLVTIDFDDADRELCRELAEDDRRVLVVFNKADEHRPAENELARCRHMGVPAVAVSARTGEHVDLARQLLVEAGQGVSVESPTIVGDLISPGDAVVLVVPIDLGAPRGRLILPQVQVIRDVLDHDAVAVTVKENELAHVLQNFAMHPSLVICDSQVVLKVAGDVPSTLRFTTFSILFSRLKGDLETFVRGVRRIDELEDGDRVLIAEACTHHPQDDDIGRVKIPRWLRQYTGKELQFDVNAGAVFNCDPADYRLVISCGGCMINRREMLRRVAGTARAGVPITNYGVAISHVHGVLRRALSPFPDVAMLLDDQETCRVAR